MVSVSASVAWWARTEPERLALVYGAQRVTYSELQGRVERAASMLQGWDCDIVEAHHTRKQQRGAEEFGYQLLAQRHQSSASSVLTRSAISSRTAR